MVKWGFCTSLRELWNRYSIVTSSMRPCCPQPRFVSLLMRGYFSRIMTLSTQQMQPRHGSGQFCTCNGVAVPIVHKPCLGCIFCVLRVIIHASVPKQISAEGSMASLRMLRYCTCSIIPSTTCKIPTLPLPNPPQTFILMSCLTVPMAQDPMVGWVSFYSQI